MKPSVLLSGAATVLCLIGAVAVSDWSTPWLLIGAAGFGYEAFTLHRKEKGDTLSETVWRGTQPLWARIPLATFMIWLTLHFVLGI